GFRLVDETQSRKIRSVTTAGTILDTGVSPVITTLDADIIIAGTCRLTRIKNDLFGESIHRFAASLEAKMIAVDTGQVLTALTLTANGMGYDPETAMVVAAKAVAARLADEVTAKSPKVHALHRYEIEVTGLPDVSASERMI